MKQKAINGAYYGFTLVEIMIVVSIIGLLAMIAIPNFRRAREKSQLTMCLSGLKVYQEVLEQYAFAKFKYPNDIADLVTEGYLKKLYDCPAGGNYDWSTSGGNQGYHLQCDGQHTPSINHVCIHEDQMPLAK
jgi:prepilin-type N-terminal cleavage/methylation domain-containing protein